MNPDNLYTALFSEIDRKDGKLKAANRTVSVVGMIMLLRLSMANKMIVMVFQFDNRWQ